MTPAVTHIAVLLFVLASRVGLVTAGAEPYRGLVLDAKSQQPISGVVVTVVWLREVSLPGGRTREEFHKAVEVLTDSQGRFTVPDAREERAGAGVEIEDAAPAFFKPGYVSWRREFRSGEGSSRDTIVIYMKRRADLTGDELKEITGPEDALQIATHPLVPASAIPRLLKALNEERHQLGLPPLPAKK